MDFSSVLAGRVQIARGTELQLRQQSVIVASELADLAVFEGEDVSGSGVGGPDEDVMFGDVVDREGNPSLVDETFGCAIGDVDGERVFGAIIFDEDGDGLAVG